MTPPTFAPSSLHGPEVLRVATYNIHKGVRGVGPRRRLEIHNLVLGIEALDADLVFLQEVQGTNTELSQKLGDLAKDPANQRRLTNLGTFRAYVEAWYQGSFQKIIFHEGGSPEVHRMISSILAGYAWDTRNPFVAEPKRRLAVLAEICS